MNQAGGIPMTANDKNKITVEIFHKSYTIVGHEAKSHVELVAESVDQKMRELQKMNNKLDTARLAVLTAVNAMNDYLKLQEKYMELERSMNENEKEEQ